MSPLVIELFAGRFGWGKGFVSEGWRCVGFDIVHEEWHKPVPPGCELVLQDVMTLHGSQFRDADAIVASPPCQAYSYRAMPWKRAKALPPPSNELFEACFRIQREASEAKGEYIPMVVENVKGAQPWVGRAKWHYGSFYLWGDVPALMPITLRTVKVDGFNFHQHENGGKGGSFQSAAVKVAGLNWSNFGKPGYKAEAFNDTAAARLNGTKTVGHVSKRDGHSHTRHLTNQRESDAVKQGGDWFGKGEDMSISRRHSSKSIGRKAASAAIAEIPFELASHVARCFLS